VLAVCEGGRNFFFVLEGLSRDGADFWYCRMFDFRFIDLRRKKCKKEERMRKRARAFRVVELLLGSYSWLAFPPCCFFDLALMKASGCLEPRFLLLHLAPRVLGRLPFLGSVKVGVKGVEKSARNAKATSSSVSSASRQGSAA